MLGLASVKAPALAAKGIRGFAQLLAPWSAPTSLGHPFLEKRMEIDFAGFGERRSDAGPAAESPRESGQVLQQPQRGLRLLQIYFFVSQSFG